MKITRAPRRAARRAKRYFARATGRDYVSYDGARLPPYGMRYCGSAFRDDETFLSSSRSEAQRLVNQLGVGPGFRILEIGCGPGRLPIGLIRDVPDIGAYHGVDLDTPAIDWCTRHISRAYPNYVFHVVDAQNDRYQPDGPVMDDTFSLPVPGNFFDLVYLYAVFTNMLERDVKVYLDVFHRVLRPGGRVFLTAFMEEGVPPITVNPAEYAPDTSEPLHFARYEKGHLLSLFDEAGFTIDRIDYGVELAGASAVYLTKR